MKTGSIPLTLALLLCAKGARSELPDYPLDDRGLKTHADYFTEDGKYLGGIPKHSDAQSINTCTELNFDHSYNATVGNDTACISWTTNVFGSPENEVGRCSCQSVMNAEYCDAWTCSDLNVVVADKNSLECSGEDIDANAGEDTADCAVTETELRSTRCVCETEDVSGNFCSSWVCLESDYEYGKEFGEYSCERASPADFYCEAWTGAAETSREADVSACECTKESDYSRVCVEWECKVRSMTKCSFAGPGWCDLGFSIGIAGFLGSLGSVLVALGVSRLVKKGKSTTLRSSSALYIILGLLWMAAWSTGVVIWGGVDGIMCASLWWGAVIIIGVMRGCFYNVF